MIGSGLDINDSVGLMINKIYKNSNYVYEDEIYTYKSLTLDLIAKYVAENSDYNSQLLSDYKRAICHKDGVPIFTRNIGYTDNDGSFKIDPSKINRRVNNDFAGYIVHTKAAYIASIPPVIGLRENVKMSDDEKQDLLVQLEDFKIKNSWDNKVLTTAEMMGSTGRACWILSIDQGEEVIDTINPWEIIEVIPNKLYIRNYKAKDFELNDVEYVDVYDKKYVMRYKDNGAGYSPEPGFPKLHLFNDCPVVIFKNNDRCLSDFYNVTELIDQYDRTASDLSSELEQFRLAYLVLTGVVADKKEIEKFKQTGVLNIKPSPGSPADAKFITKSIDIQQTIRFLEELQDAIMRFAGSFDSTSDAYTGNLTNFAIHFKLAPMDGKAKKSVTSMKDGMSKAFRIMQHTWNIKGVDFNYLDLMFLFTLNKPVNKWEEIKNITDAGGVVSDETLYMMCSSIDSATNEANRVKKEGKRPLLVSDLTLEELKAELEQRTLVNNPITTITDDNKDKEIV